MRLDSMMYIPNTNRAASPKAPLRGGRRQHTILPGAKRAPRLALRNTLSKESPLPVDASQDFLSQLNPSQREAVETIDGPLLIIAGAGSGKTRVITFRLAHMIRNRGISPWNVLAVTFTNKAAGEMKRRVIELLGGDPGPALHVATFHSSCARLLRREGYKIGLSPNFTICDDSDQLAVIKDCLTMLGFDKDTLHPGHIQHVIGQSKMRLLGPGDYASAAETDKERMTAEVFALYQKRLRENDAVDFDDLIGYVVKLFDESLETLAEYQQRFRYIMVDEYQDTNYAQYRLVEALAREHRNLCVVGDEDQSIYSWRGAEITNLLDFQKHFPEAKLVRLEQNYRSTQAILSVANTCILNNKERLGKTLWTGRDGGAKPTLIVAEDGRDEATQVVERVLFHHANGCRFQDMAIFYRANYLSRPFEDQLRKCDVPYRVIGGIRFYDRAEVKDLLAYLHVIHNPDNSIPLMRVINRPRRGIGDKTVADLQKAADRYGISCYHAIEKGAHEGEFSKGVATKLLAFRESIEKLRKIDKQGVSVGELLEAVLKETDYEARLGDPEDLEVVMRKENIAELAVAIEEFTEGNRSCELSDFLEMVSLQSSVDEAGDVDSLSLMTLHCAKGLEFKVVFVVALENQIFPNARAVEAKGDAEEERRLFYVGVTRAQDCLYLSRATSRWSRGQVAYNPVSPFLLEIPPEMLEESRSAAPAARWENDFYSGGSARGRFPLRRKVPRVSVFDSPKKRARQAAFSKGQRVRHAIFGEGTVLALSDTVGGKPTVVVAFDSGESRAFAEQFAGLKAL